MLPIYTRERDPIDCGPYTRIKLLEQIAHKKTDKQIKKNNNCEPVY